MWSYVLRRLLGLVPVLFGITLLVFLFLQLIPGDPAQAILGERGTPEQLEALREKLGLNKPLYVQYLTFVKNILTGDLGTSAVSTIPVAEELKRRWPATFELALAATLVAVVFGIPVGILAAVRKNSLLDTLSMSLSLVGVSMPVFWLGLLLVYFFAVNLHWLPTGGRLSTDLAIDFRPITGFLVLDGMLALKPEVLMDALRHLILPALTLGTIPLAILTRITRSAMLEVLSQDYVRTARAKGLAERQVILKHALKNALLPVVTLVGLQFGTLLGGAILTETIFSWPGIGSYIYEGILNRDYPVVQAGVLVVATVFVLVNLLVDLSYALLDPRISTGEPMETPTRQALRRFLKSPSGKVGLVLTLFLVLLALFIPLLKPYDPTTDRDYLNRLKPPTLEHPFGTDHLGRDVFTRVLHGSRISLQVGVISVSIGLFLGTLLGLLAGFYRGRTELLIGWLADLLLAFPGTLLAIAIVAVSGPSLQNAMLAIGIVQVPVYIRLARSMVLSLRELDFVQAAIALGAGNGRILFRHILPGTLAPLVVQATLSIGTATLEAAALGFLGLGAQPPAPEWGAMIADSFKGGYAMNAPWTMIFPGLFIMLTVLAFNLLGDGLRDALDPRSR